MTSDIPLMFPLLDYSLSLPGLLDFHMNNNPSFPIFLYTKEGTCTEISFLEFGRAAHRIAHTLRPARRGADSEVVMIIANADTILYHAVLTGLSVAGWIPFPVSPRNSAAAVVNMMKKTNCSRIVTLGHAHKGLLEGVGSEYGAGMTLYEFPALGHVYPKLGQEVATDVFISYPPSLSVPDLDTPAIYIHSSGSTGFLKPIPHSHRIQIQWMARAAQSLFCTNADLRASRQMAVMALPAFHAYGIVTQLYLPIACLTTSVVYPPGAETNSLVQQVMPTSENIIQCLKRTKCNILFTVPTFLEHMATSEEAIKVLSQLETVFYAGGPLPVKVGQKLYTGGVKLVNYYGMTECGAPISLSNRINIAHGDWLWLRFSEGLQIRWVPTGDNTYELQILSHQEHQMAIESLPDVKGYNTSDVFEKHPTKDLWKIVGRADDVIILASGEKTVPGPMESIIGSSQLVGGVVMFGRERQQVGVLIEPREGHAVDVKDEKAVAEFRNQIWHVIEEANKLAPAFSRIFKDLILITNKEKPMPRAAKGTIQRKATLKAYEADINVLYDTVEASTEISDSSTRPSAWTSNTLEAWLLEHARTISSNDRVDPRSDLFAQGLDSLSVAYLRNRITSALKKSPDPETRNAAARVPPNIVFDNPTIQLLSARIAALVNGNGNTGQAVSFMEQHKQAIDAMIRKHSRGLGTSGDSILLSRQLLEPAVVLITGTTGGLGSFLLLELLKSTAVQRVFAFNRPSSKRAIKERQRSAFEDRGLPLDLLTSDKLVYVEADASLAKFIEDKHSLERFLKIRNSLTLIIHNAWRLDFNLAMSSFDENIQASRNLVNLGLDSPRKNNIRYLFTSSIASAQGWNNFEYGSFPEEVQEDPFVAVGTSYGESKYVTERIIVKSGLYVTSLRIGQISSGPGGSWATTDWFPIIVKSSISLSLLPEAAGFVSWLREEEVASAVIEIVFAKEALPPALNIVNPRGATWSKIIASIRHAIIRRKGLGDDALPIVPFEDWFALLESRAGDPSKGDLVEIPAIKLLEFFRTLAQGDQAIRGAGVSITEAAGMTNFSTSKARQTSATMANMQAVGEVEADAWVGYWVSRGAF